MMITIAGNFVINQIKHKRSLARKRRMVEAVTGSDENAFGTKSAEGESDHVQEGTAVSDVHELSAQGQQPPVRSPLSGAWRDSGTGATLVSIATLYTQFTPHEPAFTDQCCMQLLAHDLKSRELQQIVVIPASRSRLDIAALLGKVAVILILLSTPLVLEEWMPLLPISVLVFITLNTLAEDYSGVTKDDLESLYGSSAVLLDGRDNVGLDANGDVVLIARQQHADASVTTTTERMTEENEATQKTELTQRVETALK